MRQRFTLLSKTLLLLCALMAGSGSVWAEDVTVSKTVNEIISDNDYTVSSGTSATCYTSFPLDNVITVSTSGSENCGSFWGTTTHDWRLYQNKSGNVTITAAEGNELKSIIFTFSVSNTGTLLNGETVVTSGSAIEASGSSMTFTVGNSKTATNGQVKITAFSVTYVAASSVKAPTFNVNPGTVTKGTEVTISAETGCTLKYTTDGTIPSTSSTAMTTVGNTATVTLNMIGSITLRAIALDSDANASAEATATYTVEKYEPALSFGSTTSFSCDLLKDFTAPTLTYATGWDGTATYSSSDEDVALVDEDTGEVLLIGVGTVTIIASAEATENFKAGSASYTLTVTAHEGVEPVNPAGEGKFVKVTDTNDITDGQYLIVYEGGNVAFKGSLTTLDATENTVSVTIANDEIAETQALLASAFTISLTDGGLKAASGKYAGVTSYSNGLLSSDNVIANDFSIDGDGNAVITVTVDNNIMSLRYNKASDQKRFRYYKSGQQPIQLYKYVPASGGSVTLSSYGYKTLVSTAAFQPEGATAYIVTAATEDKVTLESINVVPANTPVILYGDDNAEVTLTVKDDSEASTFTSNLLQVSDETTGDGVYVLAVKDDDVNFYKWDGGSLGAGRVYLPASLSSRQFLPFSFGEATGISATLNDNGEMTNDHAIYDLQGRQIVNRQLQRGLYIVNGKKMLVK